MLCRAPAINGEQHEGFSQAEAIVVADPTPLEIYKLKAEGQRLVRDQEAGPIGAGAIDVSLPSLQSLLQKLPSWLPASQNNCFLGSLINSKPPGKSGPPLMAIRAGFDS